jgi:nucleotide-binding universal stress UspA family protein
MSAIKLILAATDFSVNAASGVHRAARLASEHAAGLSLLHVVPEEVLSEFREIFRSSVYVEQHVLEDARRRLEALAEDLRPIANCAPECFTRVGNVLEEVLTASDYSDLLVFGAHGSRPLRDLLIGTTAERLLRKSRRPMLVAKQDAVSPYRRVIVPVDFSVHSISALRCARQIAPAVELLIFHVYECSYESELHAANVRGQTIEQYHTDRRNQALSNIESLRDRTLASGAGTTITVECGNAKTGIAGKAAELGCDLIVMGKQGRTFLGEFFLGGVTRHTVARARCDVAVVPEYSRL